MSYEIVHAIGSTLYFAFFILFLWMSRVSRTNPGAGWWAIAMLFALCARLVFFVSTSQPNSPLTISLYFSLNMLEKLFLVIGLVRFFNLSTPMRWIYGVVVAAELWLLVAWVGDFAPLVRNVGFGLFSAAIQVYVARVTYQQRHALHPRLMLVASAVSLLLAVHWVTGFAVAQIFPSWFIHGFLLGMALVMVQYFALLAALLLSFQQRLLEAESKALNLAFEDPLTGLNNQRYLTTLFDKVLALANRSNQLLAIFYIDLDNFKPINDRGGHAAGDEVLRVVANRLKNATRSTDICARIGGDEFVAICTQLENPNHASEIAGKLLHEFTTPVTVKGHDYVLGASIGVSLYPVHGNSLSKLLEYADSAMYEVKRSGKNGFHVHGT